MTRVTNKKYAETAEKKMKVQGKIKYKKQTQKEETEKDN